MITLKKAAKKTKVKIRRKKNKKEKGQKWDNSLKTSTKIS